MNDVVVSMQHIVKTFPGVIALDDVSLELRNGEVMALLGENGAGKSTLMKILSGIYGRDSGTVTIFGKEYGDLTPKSAEEAGVAIIHQELNMCRHLTVAENMYLGREPKKGLVVDSARMKRDCRKVLAELHFDIDPDTVVGELAVSKQQIVEIAKALSMDAKIIVMDEPTSALTDNETQDLFRIIHELKASGHAIVYISHRLEELQYVADRVTIMRDGHYITSGNFKDFTMDQIIQNMVGREIKNKYPRITCPVGDTVMEVKHLNAGRMVRDVSLTVRKGEILGIAGLMGAGRTETSRAIFGADPKESGQIFLNGKEVKINCPEDAIRAGIVLAPEDRRKDGLCTKLSIHDNISLPNLDILSNKAGVVNRKKEKEMVARAKKDLSIKMPNDEVSAETLSGGNMQKLVVAKWLSRDAQMIMFDEPTRGIDVAAKVEIYNIMNDLKSRGIGVLFISSELPEVLGVADRILVMCEGRITGELDPHTTTQEEILEYATKYMDDTKAS